VTTPQPASCSSLRLSLGYASMGLINRISDSPLLLDAFRVNDISVSMIISKRCTERLNTIKEKKKSLIRGFDLNENYSKKRADTLG